MKILRLSNSSDTHPGVPPELRSPAVSERVIFEATGEHAESMVRAAWPTPALPDIVDRWIASYQPDVVFFRLSSFWVAYESVPLRIERRLGPLGKPLANAGLKVGDRPWLIERSAYKAARTAVIRTIGGDTHFTPTQVGERLDATFRRIVAHESIVVAVRGTSLMLNSAGTRGGLQRSKRRVSEMNALVEAACVRLHIPFQPEEPTNDVSATRLNDDLHDSAQAHEMLGLAEGKLISDAWRAARGR